MKSDKPAALHALFLAALLAMCAPAGAQAPEEGPAISTSGTTNLDERRAVKLPPPSVAPSAKAPVAAVEEGTTIVGERESPIGLYITPWKNSFAEKELDRPARLLQEELLPLDRAVFLRGIEYYEALTGALKGKSAVTPPVALP